MVQEEAVIKFSLDYTPSGPLPAEELRELNAWRKVCYLCGLIGQDSDRYGGYGYGNISRRLSSPPGAPAFIISGSQTGHLADLSPGQYAIVTECIPAQNRVVAHGPIKPSSESLTHGAVYAQAAEVGGIIHAHSPTIWHRAHALGIPMTDAAIAYGTPELAGEIGRLLSGIELRQRGMLAMGGHTDGIIAFGTSVTEAGVALVRALALAFERD